MGLAELREVADEPVDLFPPIARFEHVIADKIVQTLNVFDCNGLIEDLHGLSFNAGQLDEPALEFLKRFRSAESAVAQRLQDSIGRLESGEIILNRTFVLWRGSRFSPRSSRQQGTAIGPR